MRKLKSLHLAENKLKEFALPEGMDALSDLELEENTLENPGPEKMKDGKAAVLRFLREQAEQGVQEVFEVKMLIVGEGDTGKTTLWNLLENPEFPVPHLDQNQPSVFKSEKAGVLPTLTQPETEPSFWSTSGTLADKPFST
ncbi:MAG: hypothetical protein IPK76_09780 [Lewinellaceae bacterium]|nr:hypothetical protein [Lewinellaceae bacterium]